MISSNLLIRSRLSDTQLFKSSSLFPSHQFFCPYGRVSIAGSQFIYLIGPCSILMIPPCYSHSYKIARFLSKMMISAVAQKVAPAAAHIQEWDAFSCCLEMLRTALLPLFCQALVSGRLFISFLEPLHICRVPHKCQSIIPRLFRLILY